MIRSIEPTQPPEDRETGWFCRCRRSAADYALLIDIAQLLERGQSWSDNDAE